MTIRSKWSILSIVLLLVLNGVTRVLEGSTGEQLAPGARSAMILPDVNNLYIPDWLKLEVESEEILQRRNAEGRNIFKMYDGQPEPEEPVVLAEENTDKSTLIQSLDTLIPEKSRPISEENSVSVLAINHAKGSSSALIKVGGSSHVVFVGDRLLDRYIVTRIAEESVFIDVLRNKEN